MATSHTKAHQIFSSGIRQLSQHIQLLDAALFLAERKVSVGSPSTSSIAEALDSTTKKYPRLNIPDTSKDRSRVIAYSRSKLHEQAIIDLYRLFSEYIRNIIVEFIHVNPTQLLETVARNKDNVLTFDRILKLGDIDSIKEEMSRIIFRRFENERSTKELLNKVLSYSKINIDEEVKQDALLYLEIRHLIIHNASKADAGFITLDSTRKVKLNANNKFSLTFSLSKRAIYSVQLLCERIDSELINANLVRKQ